MKFGDRLREKRLAMGISQQELAKRAGITARSVQNYESNKRYPNSLAITVKLAETLGTTSEYLLADEGQYINDNIEENNDNKTLEVDFLVGKVSGLFAGGKLSEEDKDAVMQAVSEAYWESKKKNRVK